MLTTLQGNLSPLGRAPVWLPPHLGLLFSWHRADLATYQSAGGAASGDGAVVGQWRDLSGNGHHFEEATTAARPTRRFNVKNGHPALQFDDVDDRLTITYGSALTQPLTVFMVAQMVATGQRYLFDGIDGTNRLIVFKTDPDGYLKMDVPGAGTEPNSGFAPGANWFILRSIFNGASASIAVNGAHVVTGDTGTATTAGTTLGNRYSFDFPMNGYIAERIVYTGALTSTQCAQVEGYASARYGITLG